MISVMKQNKSAPGAGRPGAGRTRDPSNGAVSEPLQALSDLVLEGSQFFRNVQSQKIVHKKEVVEGVVIVAVRIFHW